MNPLHPRDMIPKERLVGPRDPIALRPAFGLLWSERQRDKVAGGIVALKR